MTVVGVGAAALYLEISESRVKQLIANRRLPAIKVGQRPWAIAVDDLIHFKAQQRRVGRPKFVNQSKETS